MLSPLIEDIYRVSGKVTGELNLSQGAARDYIGRAAGVDLIPIKQGWSGAKNAGHYVLMNSEHTLYGRITPAGKTVFFDAQIDRVFNTVEDVTKYFGQKFDVFEAVAH